MNIPRKPANIYWLTLQTVCHAQFIITFSFSALTLPGGHMACIESAAAAAVAMGSTLGTQHPNLD